MLKDKKCIVCGNWVAWEGRLPCACSEHRYHEVFEAYDKTRLTKHAACSGRRNSRAAQHNQGAKNGLHKMWKSDVSSLTKQVMPEVRR